MIPNKPDIEIVDDLHVSKAYRNGVTFAVYSEHALQGDYF